MVNPSACAAECLQQRLQLEQSSVPESRTQKSCPATISTASTSCYALSRLSPAKLGLLAALLLLIVAASWPTGTSAAPRKARGAHLLWPHPNTPTEAAPVPARARASANQHRLHHVKASSRHHHVLAREARKEKNPVLHMSQVKGLSNCKAMELKATESDQLQKALKNAQNYKETVICVTEDWLYNFYNRSNIAQENKTYHFHKLELQHPLQDRVSKVSLTEEGKFLFEGPVGSLEDEMPKIIETLLVLETLVNTTKYDSGHYDCTFKYIKFAVQNNIASAMTLMKDQQCNAQKEIHYRDTNRKPFFVAMETIKVLTILEHIYEKLINSLVPAKG